MTTDEIKRRANDAVEIMLLRQQVRAGQVIIATMAKRLAEMELKNNVKRAEKPKDQRI